MIDVVLFDLDDTLLANDMADFLPAYFELLGRYAEARFEPTRVIEAVRNSTLAMIANEDPQWSNRDVFWSHFEKHMGQSRALLEPFFNDFYVRQFPHLQSVTAHVPAASRVVQRFRQRGSRLVLATNPVFPRVAIEQRVHWAGLDPSVFDLVTSYENMHATKPSLHYYREILRLLKAEPEHALMVGNDWKNDIEPALKLGMRTFHVTADEAGDSDRQGSLLRLLELLRSGHIFGNAAEVSKNENGDG